MYISWNDKIVSRDAVEAMNNRAFKYGDGVFETMRIINGKVPFINSHFERIKKALLTLKFDLSNQFNLEFFAAQIEKIIAINELNEGGRLRYTAYRAAKGFYTPQDNSIQTFIEAEKLENNDFLFNEKGLLCDICQDTKLHQTAWSSFKTLNALPYVLAAIEKKKRGLDNLILLNNHERIAETTNANLFLLKGNTIYTPRIDEGCIEGIMRAHIIKIADKMDFSISEERLHVDTLMQADEVFICNSIIGINWVVAIGNKRFLNKTSRKIFEYLKKSLTTL